MKQTYQFRIDLMDAKPPIWRRILIGSDSTLYDLHCAIQSAMGWFNYHLHGFDKNGVNYGPMDEDNVEFMEILDESKYAVSDVFLHEKDYIYYEYDFGDGWRHRVVQENILLHDSDQQLPLCIKGKNACPPEDVGGLWGYYDMLEILADKDHPEYEEIAEWIGGWFDPSEFDIDEANDRMRDGCEDMF